MHEKQEPEISNDVTQKAGGQVTDNPQLDDGTNDNVGFIEWYRRQRDNLGENRNDSNDGLGVVRTGGLVIGFVDAVNGPGARPCPEFVPTRHEVLEIARYWGSELLDNQIYWFLYGQTGSDEIRIMAFAEARLDRIAAILGTESVTAVWEQVEHKFREQLGDKLWDTFKNGNEDEWNAVRHDAYATMEAGGPPQAVPQGLLPADVGADDCGPETWREFAAYCKASWLTEQLSKQVRECWAEFTGLMDAAGDP